MHIFRQKFSVFIVVLFIILVLDLAVRADLQAQQLQLTVTVEKDNSTSNEAVHLRIMLKNISNNTVIIPQIDEMSQRTYIAIKVIHESGVPVSFLKFFAETPLARAKNTQELPAGAVLVFSETLNDNGIGPFGLLPSGEGGLLTGRFNLEAIFMVNDENLPLAGNAAVFRGTITSTDSAPPTMINITDIIQVTIDIQPGSDLNSINPRSRGVIPVAILTTDAFDATTIDPLSVRFGPNGARETHNRGHIEDVDGDGDNDMMLHFRTQETGIQCGDTSASLTGQTFDGTTIEGSDGIVTVGC